MNTKFKLTIGVFLLQFLFFLTMQKSFAQEASKKINSPASNIYPDGKQLKDANLSFKIISSIDNTWGYNILLDNKIYVHQPNVPGSAGNIGFSTKAQAEKVATLVINKLKKGIMPPTVSEEELLQVRNSIKQ